MTPRLLALLAMLCGPAVADDFPVRACVGLGDALDSPSVEGEWNYTIRQADIAMIAAAGFDTIRLPVRFSTRWDGTRIDPAFLARVDTVIRQALDANLTVILDLHHFTDLMEQPDTFGPVFAAIWAELGRHYAGWPDALIFELLNEPSEALTSAIAVDLFLPVIADLRQNHPDRWIIMGGDGWSDIDSLFDLPDVDARTALTFHYYSPYEFSHQQIFWVDNPPPPRGWGSDADRAEVKADFARAARRGGPLFLGEFGTYRLTDPAARLKWLTAVRQAADHHGIGWCIWSFGSNFGITTQNLGDWQPGMLEALGLPAAQK